MTLCLTRFCSRARPFNITLQSRMASNLNLVPAQSQTLNRDFWDKNKNLQRPISPHLGIYKIQMTTSLSILHRITGAGVGVLMYGAGVGTIYSVMTSGITFPEILQLVNNTVPHILLLGAKAAVGGSIIYHTLNGVRHLVWDMGYGFQLKHLQLSGLVVIVLTGLGTAMILVKG